MVELSNKKIVTLLFLSVPWFLSYFSYFLI